MHPYRAVSIAPEMLHSSDAQAEGLFQAAFQNAFVGIAHVSLAGEWLRVNETLSEMLGYDADELRAMTFQQITHPEDLDADLELLASLERREIEHYRIEKRYLHKRGRLIWADLQVAPQYDIEGNLLYYISSILDISATKRLEEQYREALSDAENLLHVIAHEIRRPLSTISVNAHLVSILGTGDRLAEPMAEPIAKGIQAIGTGVQDVADILSYLENMSVLHPVNEELSRCSLKAIVEKVMDVSQTSISDSRTRITVPNNLPDVLGHQVAITSVLQNLIDNAIKYRRLEQPCTISLGVKTDGDNLILTVQDTGRGIPADDLDRVFEPTSRAKNVGQTPGRGLGLALCRQLMKRMEGKIAVDSKEGAGTCFTLTFRSVESAL